MNFEEVTIYDIAAKLNLSVATISRALKNDPVVKEKTKKKILDAASQMGYQKNPFARNLRARKTNIIGVIVPRLASHFMSSVISGIEEVTNKCGYNIIISQSEELVDKEKANAKTMFDHRVDGLLVSLSHNTPNVNHFEHFFKKNIPVLFFDRVLDHKKSSSIIIDNINAAYAAVSHLIDEGCRRIVHITANTTNNVYADRFSGYRKALKDRRIGFKDEYIILSDLSYGAGEEAAKKILAMKPVPDGIFVANDNCATGCMVALKKSGVRIPQDIAFVGFNNDPISMVVEPNLTTIDYSGRLIGQVAAQHIVQRLTGTSDLKAAQTILKSELIIRESSLHSKSL